MTPLSYKIHINNIRQILQCQQTKGVQKDDNSPYTPGNNNFLLNYFYFYKIFDII